MSELDRDDGGLEEALKERLPVLPLRDSVVFPRMVAPLLVGRPASLAAVEECLASGRLLFLCTQLDADTETPESTDLHRVGVVANVLQTLRMPDGTMKVVVEGLTRAAIRRAGYREGLMEALVRPVPSQTLRGKKGQALARSALNQFDEYVHLSQRIAPEIAVSLKSVSDPATACDLICSYLTIGVPERQELLETENLRGRLEKLSGILMRENELLGIEQQVRERVREQLDRNQREHYLHEQLKAIHQELGRGDEEGDEYAELREQIEKSGMSKEAREKGLRELGRYQRTPYMSPEGAVIRTYLEWLVDLPWKKRTRDRLDIEAAQAVLDEDHYGLKKVKERILEFLAVRKLSKHVKGPILCLVGPPGVGKTSLGRSVARAMGRQFVRMSLGGIRDEAEIRGHRRTYVGSLPGRIIHSMKKAGVRNPVFMLDEIDKMNADFRGDPASALLEVLDPEQNHAFNDHYLEVDFDLSSVFFITTANSEYDIPYALHDRMEVVRLSGYTSYEKHQIARIFLVPRQMKSCGLTEKDVVLADGAIHTLIDRYTREAGVRELDRQIANVFRKVARKVVAKKPASPIRVTAAMVPKLLGKFEYAEQRADREPQTGVAVGMAWTMTGGDILHIETSVMKGKGGLLLTGSLGEVMQESAKAAYTYLRAHAEELGVKSPFHKTSDLHVHVPEGGISKDGPSAGAPIAVSMLSALCDKAPRKALAMTGEITLRGRILPVGGIKEKVLAAHRAGIRTIVLPRENERDLEEVPREIRKDTSFVQVDTIGEVFK
ncbi:MAG: endopeptidase La, partial [Nitrospiraceae bacterium]|nr:endopeptidase La [Nitrospiraceae bacterium]